MDTSMPESDKETTILPTTTKQSMTKKNQDIQILQEQTAGIDVTVDSK